MTRFILGLALVIIVASGTSSAADKYGAPAPPSNASDKCIISLAAAPKAKWEMLFPGPNTLSVTALGYYNYDDQWAFKQLKVKLVYHSKKEGVNTKYGPKIYITDESTLSTKSQWSATFTDIADPGDDYELKVHAKIEITKDAGKSSSSHSTEGAVTIPK